MGHGTAPAGTDPDDLAPIDDGTSARIGSPTPDPIGLDARNNGGTAAARKAFANDVVSYVHHKRGSRVGNGQCFTLVDRALRGGRARSTATTVPSRPTPTTRGGGGCGYQRPAAGRRDPVSRLHLPQGRRDREQ